MMRLVLVVVVLGIVALAGCGSGGPVTTCSTADECGPGRECIDGRCVEIDGGRDVPGDGADSDDSGDAPDSTVCIDVDGDGRGRGCALGLDCDDSDPARFEDCSSCLGDYPPAGCVCLVAGGTVPCYEGPDGTVDVGVCAAGTRLCDETRHLSEACVGQVLPQAREVCDDLGNDDDCDGEGDDALLSDCGDCDSTCFTDGDVEPSVDDPGASGVIRNPDGPGVTLGVDELAAGYAWIANADEGTVTKLDLSTGAEVARYRVGLTGTGVDSPSRTAVDGEGNAYVASRAHMSADMTQGSVAKMAGDLRYCVDRDGDGAIDTSTGPTPMPLGRDECVIWTVPVCGEGGIPRALTVDQGDVDAPEGYPWIGCWTEMTFVKLNPGNGAPMAVVDVDVNPYGAALGQGGWVWITGMRPLPGYVQRFNAATLAVDPRVATDPACGSADETRRAPYGITTDFVGRLWVTSFDRYACRYDPAGGTWLVVTLPRTVTRGVAADLAGRIWVSNYDWGGNALVSFDTEDGSGMDVFNLGAVAPIGVGVDEDGAIWTVNQSSNSASRVDPAARTVESFPVGTGPYTYSDFTGYHRRTMIPRGTWTHDYERCAENPTDRWAVLTWDADVPAGATLTFVAASAPTPSRLAMVPTVTLARVPASAPPVDIEAAFAAAGVPTYRLLRVTAILEAGPGAAPVLRSVRVQWHCSRLE